MLVGSLALCLKAVAYRAATEIFAWFYAGISELLNQSAKRETPAMVFRLISVKAAVPEGSEIQKEQRINKLNRSVDWGCVPRFLNLCRSK